MTGGLGSAMARMSKRPGGQTKRLIAALALLLAPFAAEAGQRATYTDNGNQQLVILVAVNGDARVTGPDPEQYGLLHHGQFYLVGRKDGQWTVARTQDIAAAFAQVMPAIFSDLAGAGAAARPAGPGPRIVAKGKRSHLGREGEVYDVHFAGSEKPDEASTILMSADPKLKPVGAALEQFTLALSVVMGAMMGPAAADHIAETRAVFALGTPLDMEGGYKLVKLEEADVANAAMELPARPQTIEQIAAEVQVRALTQEEMAEPAPDASTEGVERPEN